jgi:hypothetical protein
VHVTRNGETQVKLYLIETMPDCHRESHRAARNWGRYPGNGAERRIVTEAELPADDAEYDHVIREATERDLATYPRA